MVHEDGGPANLMRGAAVILRFPGAEPRTPGGLTLIDYGEITGKLYALAEAPKSTDVSARIRPLDDGNAIRCSASAELGRRLREHLFEPVRVSGRATWVRSDGGTWTCERMQIQHVEPIRNVSLREAIAALRAVEADWPHDPLGDLAELSPRHTQARAQFVRWFSLPSTRIAAEWPIIAESGGFVRYNIANQSLKEAEDAPKSDPACRRRAAAPELPQQPQLCVHHRGAAGMHGRDLCPDRPLERRAAMIAALANGLLARPWARTALRRGAVARGDLFLLPLRRARRADAGSSFLFRPAAPVSLA